MKRREEIVTAALERQARSSKVLTEGCEIDVGIGRVRDSTQGTHE